MDLKCVELRRALAEVVKVDTALRSFREVIRIPFRVQGFGAPALVDCLAGQMSVTA